MLHPTAVVRFLIPFALCAAIVGACAGKTDYGEQGAVSGSACAAEGERATAEDGCNTCTCESGAWACTEMQCEDGRCAEGDERFDGCQTCTCSDGTWQCTGNECECEYGDTKKDGCRTCSCVGGYWSCPFIACATECPAPRSTEPAAGCIQSAVFAKDPDTGACCQYATACQAPVGWEPFSSQNECERGGAACEPAGATQPAADGCNTCTCTAAGDWACTKLACPVDDPVYCGARLGDTCADDEYCAYAEGQHCGATDASAVCKPRPEGCDDVYSPVCGCDGEQYANACEAAAARTGVYNEGSCGKEI